MSVVIIVIQYLVPFVDSIAFVKSPPFGVSSPDIGGGDAMQVRIKEFIFILEMRRRAQNLPSYPFLVALAI